ncbi:1-acyl-sn-glycerol-3-phosphate acyltransferase [Salipaludibacillus agaradhaerens]|uniref:1-acyl-sn-glycerol-3-phosphate acyltransferase n=1 Tax=Salipaludibacillus agaradhaerens TaxID=76935 RepID=A0A9Q4B1G2_SALAG|nr:lysophospholipid acyltransferase family protein [Salipaludibacillus agaradhaerens]MCR6096410.1 1-acyl-sn-glycerol-3-phosphate acyltransferase [Salipaludibacillus agaradhaerens]MCR6114031.1 1-acyl-sn-glycerol-3-phosphate acyltransferase [Salipaludibacillus agaradhaerens]
MVYIIIKYVAKCLIPIRYNIVIKNGDKLHEMKGPLIVSSNHTSSLDPILIGLILDSPVYFMAKKELFRTKIGAWFFTAMNAISIDRNAYMLIRPIRKVLTLLERKEVVGIFPEGKRVKKDRKGKPKNGVAFFALKARVPVLPIGLIINDKRRLLRRKVTVIIGEPIDLSDCPFKNSYSQISEYIMEVSHTLINREQLSGKYRTNLEPNWQIDKKV